MKINEKLINMLPANHKLASLKYCICDGIYWWKCVLLRQRFTALYTDTVPLDSCFDIAMLGVEI